MKYIVGSGWWCSEGATEDDKNEVRVRFGDESIRGKAFHKLWYACVDRFSSPDKICVVDSCSPVKPDLNQDDQRLHLISLNENPGHSTQHTGKYSGWMRSVLLSLSYAVNCNCDYFVYIEQDVLMYGDDFIEKEIASMNKPFAFGYQPGLIQPLQQSMFIIKMSHAETFLRRIFGMKARDCEISPERKFAIASSAILSLMPEWLFKQPDLSNVFGKLTHRIQTAILKTFASFDTLKAGYGRHRPIDFSKSHFYFQHGSTDELAQFLEKLKQE